jgi:hypothetical protein
MTIWSSLDLLRPEYAPIRPLISERTHNGARLRIYSLPNAQLEVLDGRMVLRSGSFVRQWGLDNMTNSKMASLFWRIEKYMFVIETVTGLTNYRTALAHDASDAEKLSVDIILQPMNGMTTPKLRLIIEIPHDPSLLATVTFCESFWFTPTNHPVLRRRNAKHFGSTTTLARFIQRQR